MRASRVLIASCALVSFSSLLSAQTTWTGAISTSWDNPFNWSTGLVPGPTTDVVIAPAANQPSSYIFTPTCLDLTVQAGAALTLSPGFDLDVRGDLLILGGVSVSSASSEVFVAQGFTNNGSLTLNGATVDLTGPGALTGTAATVFEDLVISGGVRSVLASATVNGDVTVKSAGKLDITAGQKLLVRGNWTSSAPGASTTGAGLVEFEGTGILTSGLNGLPNATITSGVRSVNAASVTGNLVQSGGTLNMLDNAGFLIGGNATLSGGTLTFTSLFPGQETLDINGNATFNCSAGSFSPEVRILCAGNWTSSAVFAPLAGSVELDGVGTRTLGGASPSFFNLRVAGTIDVQAPFSVAGTLLIDTGATLAANQTVDVNGSVVLGAAPATLDLGGLTHTVAGNWTSAGGSATNGTLRFDGPGTIASGSGSIANAIIATSGVRTVGTVSVTGDLELSSGELRIADGSTLSVGGEARLFGGVLAFADATALGEALDVEGTVFAQGTSAGAFNAGAQILCAGDWVSGGGFVPTQGVVRLDGAAPATLSGSAPTFYRLRISGGTKTIATPTTLAADLQIDAGGTLVTSAVLDVAGFASLGGVGAFWDQGGLTHRVGTNLSSTGGAITNGTTSLDGTGGTVSSAAGSFAALRVLSGARTFSSSNLSGDLSLLGGTTTVGAGALVSVAGSANLNAGTLGLGAAARLAVANDVVCAGTTADVIAPGARMEFGHAWVGAASWAPASGVTAYTGGPGGQMTGTAQVYSLAVESGDLTVGGSLSIAGNLSLSAPLVTPGPLSVAGDVTLGATVDWDLAGMTHSVAGNWTSGGASALNGVVRFTGDGSLTLNGGTIAAVDVAGGIRTAKSGTIAGNLSMSAGTLRVDADQALAVQGDALFSGGLLSWYPVPAGALETLTVAGAVTCNAGIEFESANARFTCRGNWTSGIAFAPTQLGVVLDGPTPTSIGGAPRFADLSIANSTRTVLASTLIAGDLDLASGSALDASAATLDVNGSVVLASGSTLNLGALNHKVAGNWTASSGTVTGTGVLEFDGSGSLSTGVGGSISNALVSAGTRDVLTSVISGTLTLSGGTLRILNDQVLTVQGTAALTGGTLAFVDSGGQFETLDAKDVILTASAGAMNANSLILCSGNWSSTSAWSPSAGSVVLDGGTSTTIGGTAPVFFDLLVLSGQKTLQAPALIGGNLSVFGGQTLTTTAPVEVLGGVALLAGATWNSGQNTHRVHKDWLSTGATVANSSIFEFVADGTLTTGISTLPNMRVASGTRRVNSSTVHFSLEQTGGTLLILDNQVLIVEQNLLATGGTLSFENVNPGLDVLLVQGNVVNYAAAAGNLSANSLIEVHGSWSSTPAFAPTAGVVRLAPAGAATLSGAGPRFANLEVTSGVVTANAAAKVSGSLTIASGAALITPAGQDVDGAVILGDAGAAWDVSTGTHTVQGDWTSAGGSASGSGWIVFDGPGSVSTGGGHLPNVRIVSGVRAIDAAEIQGNVELVGGALGIEDNALFHATGSFNATGGVLAFATLGPGAEVLDIDGNVTIAGAVSGATNPDVLIRCGGNWSSGSTWAPVNGTVVLDGAAPATLGGAGLTLPALRLSGGSKTLTGAAALKSLDLVTGASLFTQGAMDISGFVTLGAAPSALNLGGLTHLVTGSFTSIGANTINGTLEFDGTGTLSTGTATLANARISAGTRSADTSTISGLLTMTGGSLVIGADQTLSVLGNANLNGGTLAFFATDAGLPEVLDVAGDVSLKAAAGSSSAGSRIRCAGDWSSSSAFDLSSGIVELDGTAPSLITGLAPTFDPSFPSLVLKNGMRSAGGDLTLRAESLRVESGATLEIAAQSVAIPAGLVTVDGELALDAGGELALGLDAFVLVSAAGKLSLLGAFGDPAVVTGDQGGGYLLAVDGTLDAQNFRIEEMGPSGVSVTQTATVLQMLGGAFARPWPTVGSLLLDIRRPVPSTYSYLSFEEPLGAGAKNVRTLGGAKITFANASGDLAGATYEVDPLALIDWTTASSSVASFEAEPAADAVNLSWVSTQEVDVESWVVERAVSSGGPFSAIGELPAAGPGSYALADTLVVAKQDYFYRLMEKKPYGALIELASASATPWSSVLPANVLAVGGGGFPDVQSALAAVSGPGYVLRVSAGTYPAFTVGSGLSGTLRILGDGSGPVVIDTSAAPLLIQNLPASASVELSDLTIGSAGSPNAGIVIDACAGIVILDELNVQGGAGKAGVRASASTRVALQRCLVSGTPGFEAVLGSVALFGGGALDEVVLSGASNVRLAAVSPTPTVEAGSTLTTLPGVHADLGAPEFLSLGQTFTLSFSGEPGGIYALAYSGSLAWFDLPNPWEMVGLLNIAQAPVLLSGVLGAAPIEQVLPVPADGALFGAAVPIQMVVVNPTTFKFRWSNASSLIPLD